MSVYAKGLIAKHLPPTVSFNLLLFLWICLTALSAQAGDHEKRSGSSLLVSPSSVSMSAGSTAELTVSNASGRVSVESGENAIVDASYSEDRVILAAFKAGSTTVTVRDRRNSREIPVTVVNATPPPLTDNDYTLLAWNDLGMHCVDGKDYSIFSILPPLQ